VILNAMITCPLCGHRQAEIMPAAIEFA